MLQHGECGVTVFKIYTQLYVTKQNFDYKMNLVDDPIIEFTAVDSYFSY